MAKGSRGGKRSSSPQAIKKRMGELDSQIKTNFAKSKSLGKEMDKEAKAWRAKGNKGTSAKWEELRKRQVSTQNKTQKLAEEYQSLKRKLPKEKKEQREITSSTYKRAQRNLNRDFDKWFGRR